MNDVFSAQAWYVVNTQWLPLLVVVFSSPAPSSPASLLMHKIPPPEFFSYNLRLYLFLKCRHKQEWYLIKPNQAFTRQHGGVCKTLKREPGNWEYKLTNPLGWMAPCVFKLFWRGLAYARFPARQKDNRPRSRTTAFLSTWWVRLLQSIEMFLSLWHSGLPSISVRVLQKNRTSRRLSSSLSIIYLSPISF